MCSENAVADALSRQMEGVVAALSLLIPHWVELIKEEIFQQPSLQDLVQRIQEGEVVGPWKVTAGIIYFNDRTYLLSTSH